MFKKILFFVIIYISITNLFAQDPSKLIAIDNNGFTYEIDPLNCSYTQINQCAPSTPYSIALINNYVYYTSWLGLYRYQYNTSGTCEFLGVFNYTGSSNLTGLTSGPDGLIYAVAGSTIFRYNPTTGVFSNLGSIPNQWQSSGDLVFFNGQLLLSTTNDKLVQIDLNNLSNTQEVLSFPQNTDIFGLSTISPSCGSNLLFAINSTSGSTTLLPIDLTTNTVGSPVCNFPFRIYDTASLAENGSSSNSPIFTQVAAICSGANLTTLPTTSNNGITGTWSPALNNTNTTTYTFTPAAGQCATTATMTITVSPNGIPTFTQVAAICSGANLATLPTISNNGIAGTWSPTLNNTNTTTYTFTPTNGQCETTMTITVNPIETPIFNQVPTICSGSTLAPLPTTSNNGITGTWSPAPNNTNTTTYTFTPLVDQCATTATMTIMINPLPGNPNSVQHPEICSGDSTNINVTTTPQITGTTLNWQVIGSSNYVSGYSQSGSGPSSILISDNLINNTNNQGFVTYRVKSFLGNCEGSYIDITVLVNPLPKPNLKNGFICVNETNGTIYTNYVLDSQLSNPDFIYEWYLLNTTTNNYDILASANGSSYLVNQEGTYKIVVTNTATTCKQNDVATVTTAYPAQGLSATITNAFTDNTIITVTVNPTVTYNLIYSLDNGSWQDSNIFTGVKPGQHTITVVDLEGCTNLSIEITVIDFPKFFTPNGDDINDTWNILGLNQPEAKLFIFDRYGKLIKQLNTTSKGWDGTYNGTKLPSTDYWFELDYNENGTPKQFKSHFSLKR